VARETVAPRKGATVAASTTLTLDERRLRAKIAANRRWSRPGERQRQSEATSAARLRRHEQLVDPDRRLPPAERRQLAANSMAAEMAALSLKASKARRAKAVTSGTA
jgi:hypothetical protein